MNEVTVTPFSTKKIKNIKFHSWKPFRKFYEIYKHESQHHANEYHVTLKVIQMFPKIHLFTKIKNMHTYKKISTLLIIWVIRFSTL